MDPIYLYACLIDILAYKHHLELDRNKGVLDFKSKLLSSLNIFDHINNTVFQVQAISDTVILTCNQHEQVNEFLKIIREIFLKFLSNGLFIRGGIAYSRHFQNQKMTYSHAIARAYDLESKFAVYPRIIIDNNIVDMYSTGNSLPTIENLNLLCQANGITFLNIIEDYGKWLQIYEKAKNLFENEEEILRENEVAFAKHFWFQEYLFSYQHADLNMPKYIPKIKFV